MQHLSGPGQGPFTTLVLFISGILRILIISILGVVAFIIGLAAFLIIIVPLLIYLLITKRKFINFIRSSKTQFKGASFKNSQSGSFRNFSSQQGFHSSVQNEEEVDIDIPAKSQQ